MPGKVKLTTRSARLIAVLSIVSLTWCPTPAADSAYSQGLDAYRKGDFPRASAYFEQALQKTQNDPLLWYYDAICFHQLKNWTMAKSRYKTTAVSFPNTEAGKRAAKALKSLDPHFVLPVIATAVPTQTDGTSANGDAAGSKASSKNSSSTKNTATTKATSKGNSEGDDDDDDDEDDKEKSKAAAELAKELATLPDTAHFYFKKGPGGHMEVDLMVNGHPVKALFDTGASAFFYKDQLKEAGLDLNKAKVGQGARGWAGVKVDTEIIPAVVKLGTMTRNINITMQETTGHLGQNLIGQDFIKGYQYEIDDKGGRVDLKKTLASANSKIDRLYDIPLEVVGTKDYIGFSVNGVYAKAFIDTGASNTIFNALWAARAGIQPTGETVHMTGVGGNVEMQRAYVTIRIGGMYRENFPVLIGGAAGCALGQDLMDGWRYKVDRERKLLRFFH